MFFQWLSLDYPWRHSWWSGRTSKKGLCSSQSRRSSGWWVEDVLNKCAVPRKNKHTHSYLSRSNFSCILQRILSMVQFILKWPLTYIKRLSMMLRSRSFINIYFINMLSFCDHQVFERKFLSFVPVIAHGNFSNPHGDA